MIDHRFGRIMNANIAEYHVPVNADIHDIDVIFVDEPDAHINPLGIKGVGEIGIVGVAGGDRQCDLSRDRQTHPRSSDHAGQAARLRWCSDPLGAGVTSRRPAARPHDGKSAGLTWMRSACSDQ